MTGRPSRLTGASARDSSPGSRSPSSVDGVAVDRRRSRGRAAAAPARTSPATARSAPRVTVLPVGGRDEVGEHPPGARRVSVERRCVQVPSRAERRVHVLEAGEVAAHDDQVQRPRRGSTSYAVTGRRRGRAIAEGDGGRGAGRQRSRRPGRGCSRPAVTASPPGRRSGGRAVRRRRAPPAMSSVAPCAVRSAAAGPDRADGRADAHGGAEDGDQAEGEGGEPEPACSSAGQRPASS